MDNAVDEGAVSCQVRESLSPAEGLPNASLFVRLLELDPMLEEAGRLDMSVPEELTNQ